MTHTHTHKNQNRAYLHLQQICWVDKVSERVPCWVAKVPRVPCWVLRVPCSIPSFSSVFWLSVVPISHNVYWYIYQLTILQESTTVSGSAQLSTFNNNLLKLTDLEKVDNCPDFLSSRIVYMTVTFSMVNWSGNAFLIQEFLISRWWFSFTHMDDRKTHTHNAETVITGSRIPRHCYDWKRNKQHGLCAPISSRKLSPQDLQTTVHTIDALIRDS